MERNKTEQINKIPTKAFTFVPHQTGGCNAVPDVTAPVLVSKVCIIFVKQILAVTASPVDSPNKEPRFQEGEKMFSGTLLAQHSSNPHLSITAETVPLIFM